ENIKSTLTTVYAALYETDQPLIQQLKSLNNQLSALKNFHPGITGLTERLQSSQVELQDIADEIEHLNNGVTFSEERINSLNERLALGYRLLKKHGVQKTSDLILIKNDLLLKLNKISGLSELITIAEQAVQECLQNAVSLADKLSLNRHKQIRPFEQKVNSLLSRVGMPNAKIKVRVEKGELNLYGLDTIEFLFDANNNGRFEPLRKVASGGELSRVMLCIKSLVAKSVQLPTLIFDEIDTGISGEAARQVAMIMQELSASHQLVTITHQPQIAAKASAHYFVYKEIKENRIVTSVKLLNRDEQITTIATMLSGERPTAAAFENAREMIGN
ncbi:MAG: DNA repair protein RecN, partial [Ginsengibacter sp.]